MTATLEELERRVTDLEKAQRENRGTLEWISGTLGKIAATQDNHTTRLDKLDRDVSELKDGMKDVKAQVQRLEGEFNTFRREFPGQIADVMREVLREKR